MKPAKRTLQVKEYYFSKKLDEIRHLESTGQSIINLGIGSPDMVPHKSLNGVMTNALSEHGSYAYKPYKGTKHLRQAFSDWYLKMYGVELQSEGEIMPLMGSKEGISHISLAYLDAGDKVLVPNPGYPAYKSAAEVVGATPVLYNLTAENNWYPDLDELERITDEKVKLLWLNYPHMPTGQNSKKAVFESLIKFAKRKNILICNDNPYSFILNPQPLSILSIPGAKEVAIELNSLSKSHNLAGARVGMLVGNAEIIGNVFKIFSNFSSGMFGPIQQTAIAAMQLEQDWYAQQNKEYRLRKTIACRILDLLECTYSNDGTGLFVWGKIPNKFESGERLSDLILNEAQVFITPGFIFGSNGHRYIRISLCSPCHILSEAHQRIMKLTNNKQPVSVGSKKQI